MPISLACLLRLIVSQRECGRSWAGHAAWTSLQARGGVVEVLGSTDAMSMLRFYGHALLAEVSTAGDRIEARRAAHR
jgi:hypothetical protein